MKAQYYSSPENVIFINPFIRFLARIFGAKYFVIRCNNCKRIPTELHGNTCNNCVN